MFAIAKNNHQQTSNWTVSHADWCKEYINETNFENQGFMIKGITKKNNINPRFLSMIEINKICDTPTDYTAETTSANEFNHKQAILPFGIPKTPKAMFSYQMDMENIYNNGPSGKYPDENITCSVLMAILRKAIFDIGREEKQYNETTEKHFIKIIMSMFYTMKKFYDTNIICKSLIDGLADCVLSRDVTQREITILLSGNQLTEKLFEEILIVGFSRSMKHFKEKYGENIKYTLTKSQFLRGKFGLFFIIPLLYLTKEYNESSVNKYHDLLKQCYDKFYATDYLANQINDNDWQITCKMCSAMYNIMVDITEFKMDHKDDKYFYDMLNKISVTDITNIDTIVTESSSEKYIPTRANISSKQFTCYPKITQSEDSTKTIIMSQRITKWSTFIIKMNKDEIIKLSWIAQINANKNTKVSQDIMFICMNKENIKLNASDYYSPISKIMVYKQKKMVVPHNEDYVLLHKNGNEIEILTETGKIIIKGDQLMIALKNIKLEITNNLKI